MRLAFALLLFATPAIASPARSAAEDERPRFFDGCSHDSWICFENFPAMSRDQRTIINAVKCGEDFVLEVVSIASSRVLRREDAFRPHHPRELQFARLHRALRGFRAMPELASGDLQRSRYRRGSVTLEIEPGEVECRPTYRVTRRRH